jgi:hypothetical protein
MGAAATYPKNLRDLGFLGYARLTPLAADVAKSRDDD